MDEWQTIKDRIKNKYMLSWVISIELSGCCPYNHLVFYIYLVPSLMN